MKKTTFFLTFAGLWLNILCLLHAQAQDCNAAYKAELAEGDRLFQQGEYWKSVQKYNIVMIICSEQTATAQQRIKTVFDKITSLRQEAENAKQSAVNMIEALAGKQENYYAYFYGLGKTAYDLGEYDDAVSNLILADESFDKPIAANLQALLAKARQCQTSQNKAYALIQEKKYEEAEQQIAITHSLNPTARKTRLIAAALNPTKYGLSQVPSGSYMMGSEEGEDDEKPIHEVRLDSFALGSYEVTNLAYAIFLNRYGSSSIKQGEYEGEKMIVEDAWGLRQSEAGDWVAGTPGYDFYPVVYVSWYGAYEYCKHYGGRLPTESEWEYAARNGNNADTYLYAGSNNLDEIAWYTNNASSTQAVGKKKANALGLYDMSGNVWEWCNDWYKGYSTGLEVNPMGAESGAIRVLRGGSWGSFAEYCRSALRGSGSPSSSGGNGGFRFCISL